VPQAGSVAKFANPGSLRTSLIWYSCEVPGLAGKGYNEGAQFVGKVNVEVLGTCKRSLSHARPLG